jgi:hypothetical protein
VTGIGAEGSGFGSSVEPAEPPQAARIRLIQTRLTINIAVLLIMDSLL